MTTAKKSASYWAAAALAAAAFAAYHNSFSGPFVFDDRASILDNTTIRSLWPLGPVFSPPAHAGLGGRPILNLTLALNYAAGGLRVGGYHAVNLLIHIVAGLALFGIVRRTLRWASIEAVAKANDLVAFAIALLWTVHPLQTEAVTWISGRAESLMGMFYLLTVYLFIRYIESEQNGIFTGRSGRSGSKTLGSGADSNLSEHLPAGILPDLPDLPVKKDNGTTAASRSSGKNRLIFAILSVLCCALGMASKEVMVTAPLVVLLYDRTFVSGTFRSALRRRAGYYAALAATWLALGRVLSNAHEQGVGLGLGGSWLAYALGETRVIVRYLELALWPHPLVFDRGTRLPPPGAALAPYVLAVDLLLAATVWALFVQRRRSMRALGFAGAWFFLVLAPTSSVVAVAGQPMAEHRMYLPLAAVIGVIVCVIARALAAPQTYGGPSVPPIFVAAVTAAAVAGIFITTRRNRVYRSALSLWSDTAAKAPDNERAQNAWGEALAGAGRLDSAMAHYRAAIALRPDYVEAHRNLGGVLKEAGSLPEAAAECEEAVRLRPADPDNRSALGIVLQAQGRYAEAAAQFQEALRSRPDDPETECNLGAALVGEGEPAEAIPHFEAALREQPENPDARYDLAGALASAGRRDEAIGQFQQVLERNPDDAAAHDNLGIALAGAGRLGEAAHQLRAALRLQPNRADYHFNLGVVLWRDQQSDAARAEFERALALQPGYAEARRALDRMR